MSLSDSMFLFEIFLEELKSYVDCREFYIRCQFGDVFTLNLKDPNDLTTLLPKHKKLKKKKVTVRNVQNPIKKDIPDGKLQSGQSILFTSNIEMLISSMERFPIELSLWDKDDIENKMGSTHIPWSPEYIEYLHKITIKQNPAPAFVSGGYNIFDEYSSKRMATIRLNIKLTYLKDKITNSFRSLSENNQKTSMFKEFNLKATTVLSTINDLPGNLKEDTGIIRTIYSSGKRSRLKTVNKTKSKATEAPTCVSFHEIKELKGYETPKEVNKTVGFIRLPDTKCKVNQSIVSLVKSDTELDRTKTIEVIKTKSCTSINREQYNILDYIFSDSKGPCGNQVYCVGYCTVENDFAQSSATSPSPSKGSVKATSEKSDDERSKRSNSPKGRYKFRLRDCQCPSQESVSSVDLLGDDLITVTKCNQVECNSKINKDVPEPDDERILLDLKNLTHECCDVNQTVEEVTGGMKAKMKFKEDDCFCSCECTFGFVKKTTYCGVCGGFEKPGEDFSLKSLQEKSTLPFPCPIFHKLQVDKSKLKSWSTSGSDTKKKADDSPRNLKAGAKSIGSAKSDKNAESEKDSKKGKKKKKDDRFKFNYGYTAPQIGHSQCAMPCTGTLGAVPRNMGWLWTAEDVPGLREGWRPGAVNKRVLKNLNRAKKCSTTGQQSAPIRKQKRQVEDKPALIICKRNGEYIVEMQTESQEKRTVCNPLIYKITGADNSKMVIAKARKERCLVRKAVGAAWSDPYNPDACQETCYKAYKQAIWFDPFDPCNPECVCPEEYEDGLDSCSCSEDTDADLEASSLDVDWEIHFTPPSYFSR